MTDAIGHNSQPNASELASYVERVMTFEVEKRNSAESIKEILIEAKDAGFDAHAIRACVKIKLRDAKQTKAAKERAAIVEVYATALQLDLPL